MGATSWNFGTFVQIISRDGVIIVLQDVTGFLEHS